MVFWSGEFAGQVISESENFVCTVFVKAGIAVFGSVSRYQVLLEKEISIFIALVIRMWLR